MEFRAGRVSGIIIKKITADTNFKGYTHHASREEPQYLIKSDKTDHIAIHKGTALRLIPARARKSATAKVNQEKEQTMTSEERMQREANLIATIRAKLPISQQCAQMSRN